MVKITIKGNNESSRSKCSTTDKTHSLLKQILHNNAYHGKHENQTQYCGTTLKNQDPIFQ